jgi:hypothetical protein
METVYLTPQTAKLEMYERISANEVEPYCAKCKVKLEVLRIRGNRTARSTRSAVRPTTSTSRRRTAWPTPSGIACSGANRRNDGDRAKPRAADGMIPEAISPWKFASCLLSM